MISHKIEKSCNGDDIDWYEIWQWERWISKSWPFNRSKSAHGSIQIHRSVEIDRVKIEVGRVLSCNCNAIVMKQLPETEIINTIGMNIIFDLFDVWTNLEHIQNNEYHWNMSFDIIMPFQSITSSKSVNLISNKSQKLGGTNCTFLNF